MAVSSLQSGQQVLQGTVQTLHGDVRTLQGTVQTLQGTVQTLQSTVQTLHGNVQTLQITVEKSQETLQALQRIVEKQQETIIILQTDVAAIKVQLNNCATKADVEAIRAELFRTLAIYTVKAFVWVVTACSALSSAVYFIARNVR